MDKKALRNRLALLERRHPESNNDLPRRTVMIKGRWWNPDPEVCKRLPEPVGVGVKIKIAMWSPRDDVQVYSKSNFHLLPCDGCAHFGVKCNGPENLKLDVPSILAR